MPYNAPALIDTSDCLGTTDVKLNGDPEEIVVKSNTTEAKIEFQENWLGMSMNLPFVGLIFNAG